MTNSTPNSPRPFFAGRGGAGNFSPNITPKSPSLKPTETLDYHPQNEKVRTGRGGSGNTVQPSQVHTVTPSEYLTEVQAGHAAYDPPHVAAGRGGAGNHKRDSSVSRSPALRPTTSSTSQAGIHSTKSPLLAALSPRLAALSPRLRPHSSPRMKPIDDVVEERI